jgi:hypothetical protein
MEPSQIMDILNKYNEEINRQNTQTLLKIVENAKNDPQVFKNLPKSGGNNVAIIGAANENNLADLAAFSGRYWVGDSHVNNLVYDLNLHSSSKKKIKPINTFYENDEIFMSLNTLADSYRKLQGGYYFNEPDSEFQVINNFFDTIIKSKEDGSFTSTQLNIYIHSSPREFCHGCLITLLQLKIALKSHNINARIHASSDGAPTFEILPRILDDHGQAAITDMIGILTEHLNDNYDNVVADHGLQDNIETFFGHLVAEEENIAIDLLSRDFEDWNP